MGSEQRSAAMRLLKLRIKRRALLLFGGAKVVVVTALCLVVVVLAIVGYANFKSEQNAEPNPSALTDAIPAVALDAYRTAALRCPGLDWTVLAGVGQVETQHGALYGASFDAAGTLIPPIFGPQLDGSGAGGNLTPFPIGRWQGWWGLAGPWQQAMGPMQFMPETWNRLGVDESGDGVADPQNVHDATAAAADLLCQAGAATDVATALRSYNDSSVYVDRVLHEAALLTEVGGSPTEQSQALAEHPHVAFTDWARQDLLSGIVDPRLVTALLTTAQRFRFSVGYFRTNHAPCVAGTGSFPECTISQHWVGRAVDIGSVEGQVVSAGNAAARSMVEWWFPTQPNAPAFAGPVPQNLGSPWPDVFGFSDRAHQNHLHVSFLSTG